MSSTMRAMLLEQCVSLLDADQPLVAADIPIPDPRDNEVLIKVTACAVCHTELDEIEGRLPPRLPIVPGHQVIGHIVDGAPGTNAPIGDRVGVGWIHHSDGSDTENLSGAFVATGKDVNGGYAQYMTAPIDYTYPIPANYSDVEAAPLLCAGAIGFRALKIAQLRNGDVLGLTGFGASAHLVLQLAKHLYPESPVYVFARDADSRDFAAQLGADWVGEIAARAPQPAAAIIDTTPAWLPVIEALNNLSPGGRLVINAIRKEGADQEALLNLRYHDHLWMEREVKSVANITGADIAEFLPIAASIPLRTETETYALADANKALVSLKRNPTRGAKVLLV